MSDRKRKLDIGDLRGSSGINSMTGPSGIDIFGNEDKKTNLTNPWTGNPYSSRYYEILKKRQMLPVYEFKTELLMQVAAHQTIVVEGETGSGKTTQIPQFLLPMLAKPGSKAIACTQPRRVAAMSIAKRVAEEMDVEMGEQVTPSGTYPYNFLCSDRSGLTLLRLFYSNLYIGWLYDSFRGRVRTEHDPPVHDRWNASARGHE
jgi:hypothetical protein